MKMILPIVLVLLGLAGGVGAGIALKPAAHADAAPEACAEDEGCTEAAGDQEIAPDLSREFVSLEKPFVVPIFGQDRVTAMVVLSLSVEVPAGEGDAVKAVQPRLRDGFLAVLFRHANSGGFNGSFTVGEKMTDLKSALLKSAREVLVNHKVGEVLVTEIIRQDV
jgi:flagellar protein FliL